MDDIACLAIETCLMSGAPFLFSRTMVDELEEAEIYNLAKESPEAAGDREGCLVKLKVLQACMSDLKNLDKHGIRQGGKFS